VVTATNPNDLSNHAGSTITFVAPPFGLNAVTSTNINGLTGTFTFSATDSAVAGITGTPAVDGLPVLVVSGIAALVMTAGALILHGDADDGEGEGAGEAQERDLSVAAVLLDTIADAAAAAGVAVAGGIILATGGWYWLDPAVALAIAVVVAYHAQALIRKVLGRLRSRTADSNT